MGLFDGIGEARTRNNSAYFSAGSYILRLDKVKASTNRSDVPIFAIEMTVLHVLEPGPDTWDGKPFAERTHRPGDSISHVISKKFKDMFLPNIKAFVSSVMNMNPDSITAADVETIVSEEGPGAQPLSGWVIQASGRMVKTKANKDFTEISYRGVVPAVRLKELLSQKIVDLYFGGGEVLDQLIEWEAAQEEQA